MVQTTISGLQSLLKEVPAAFISISPEEAATPRPGGKWSKLQLLGHLCDSAINNMSRFIKVQYEPQPLRLALYDQNEWMAAQQYGSAAQEEVLALWVSLNQAVLRVISSLTRDQLQLVFLQESGETVTLQWLIEDYLEHMKHHLGQIFPGESLQSL
ncbi:DinB family protein [Paenibacillus graminis]|uniref:DinB family protein n=1 Tax=Paenibacillus graminis TaxID=189425 RepID=UPI002DB7F8F4|nr:DinB family protein [Paenibacillus graminis]MEC0168719.1 DinB family protein [Paenibacillus graminis]